MGTPVAEPRRTQILHILERGETISLVAGDSIIQIRLTTKRPYGIHGICRLCIEAPEDVLFLTTLPPIPRK